MDPSPLFEQYRQLVRQNQQQVRAAEGAAPLAVVFLPFGRVLGPDFELFGTESCYALVNLFKALNDYIIFGGIKHEQLFARLRLSDFNEKLVHYIRLFLSVVVKIQMACEVFFISMKSSEKSKWSFVLALEVIKALGRAVLVRLLLVNPEVTNSIEPGQEIQAILPAGGQYEPTEAPQQQQQQQGETAARDPAAGTPKEGKWVGRRSGKALAMNQDLARFSASQSRNATDRILVNSPHPQLSLVQHEQMTQLKLVGETLHIIRPVVYVLLHEEFFGQKGGEWTAWGASLLTDLASIACTSASTTALGSSDQIKTELSRRIGLLPYYFMRKPVYDRIVESVKSLISTGEDAGRFSSLVSYILSLIDQYHRIHFYISAS